MADIGTTIGRRPVRPPARAVTSPAAQRGDSYMGVSGYRMDAEAITAYVEKAR